MVSYFFHVPDFSFVFDPVYLSKPWFLRTLQIQLLTHWIRLRYYSAWCLTTSAMILCGAGYDGHSWEGLMIIFVFMILLFSIIYYIQFVIYVFTVFAIYYELYILPYSRIIEYSSAFVGISFKTKRLHCTLEFWHSKILEILFVDILFKL